MSMSVADEFEPSMPEKPGAQLACIREKKGLTREYIAGRLNLRVRVIELLENDEYADLPEPVFIKGYLRAYAKLLGLAHEPFIVAFKGHYSEKAEKATLWQAASRKNKNEIFVRFLTILLTVGVVVAGGIWWYKQSAPVTQELASKNNQRNSSTIPNLSNASQLSNLSTMQSMFSTSEETQQSA